MCDKLCGSLYCLRFAVKIVQEEKRQFWQVQQSNLGQTLLVLRLEHHTMCGLHSSVPTEVRNVKRSCGLLKSVK